jgi:protein-disulfide isomerase
MFIPPKHIAQQLKEEKNTQGQLQLRSSHLLINSDLAHEFFKGDNNVYIVYYPDKKALMIAPISDELFKKLHKASQAMLKNSNQQGDKSIALHDILIDHQLDGQDRALDYECLKGLGILNVRL